MPTSEKTLFVIERVKARYSQAEKRDGEYK
jgi:hypothetical protein